MLYEKVSSALRVSVVYLLFSVAWIFFSDRILGILTDDIQLYQQIQTYKGWFFVLISAVIIYALVHREVEKLKDAQDNISKLKSFDKLTGLYNRDSFLKEINKIHQESTQVSIISIDINGLSMINEVFSYQTGDNMIVAMSNILKDNLPEDAYIARVGGDEFAVVLYKCSYETAGEIVDKLQNVELVDNEAFHGFSIGYSTTCENLHSIYDSVRLSEQRLHTNKMLNIGSRSNAIIQTIKSSLYEKSDETEMHAERMSEYCTKVANKMGYQSFQIDELKLFAMLHDIGKIGVDDSILKKPDILNELEVTEMRKHPLIGYKMASAIPPLVSIAYYILTHHERWDGTGYPNGLRKEAIPLNSRILSVVDAYDAMTNDRVYRSALTKEEAIQELKDNSGTQFDPKVVDIFIELV